MTIREWTWWIPTTPSDGIPSEPKKRALSGISCLRDIDMSPAFASEIPEK
jgi:hypothetical protein